MCYFNECTYCGSPILVGDSVIHLGEELFHEPCFADYNDEVDRVQPINHGDEEWDDWACQYDDDPNPYSGT